jgi:fibronectin-binding autotransporter adhesin
LKRRRNRVAACLAVAFLLAATVPPRAVAADRTWSNSGTNTLWSNTLNWLGQTLPLATDDVWFGQSFSMPTVTLDQNSSVRSFRISTASSFTLTGTSSLTLGTLGLIRSATSSGTQTLAAPIVLGTSNTWTIDGEGGVRATGGISSGTSLFGITKAGAGTLTLAGSSSYRGITRVNLGTLLLAPGGSIANSANIFVGAGVDSGSQPLLSIDGGWLSGSNANVASAPGDYGTMSLSSGSLSLSRDLTVGVAGDGQFLISGGSAGIANAITIGQSGNGVFVMSGGTITNLATTIGSSPTESQSNGIATVSGGRWVTTGNFRIGDFANSVGALTLSGSGEANIRSGTGTVSLGVQAGSQGTLTLGNGTTAGLLSAGAVEGGLGTAQVVFNHASGSYAFTPRLTGTLTVAHTASGRTILSGSNAYVGTTTISSGTLQFANRGSLYGGGTASWTAANLTAASGATLMLTVGGTGTGLFNAGDVDLIDSLGTATGGLQSGASLGFDTSSIAGGTFAYATALRNPNSGSNAIGVTKIGAGTLLLSGSNSYTGRTRIEGGTLQFANRNALYGGGTASWTAANLVTGSGAILALNVGGTATNDFTAADVDLIDRLGDATGGFQSGAILGLDTTTAAGGTFTFGNAILNPNAGGNVLGFAKLGAGTLVLSGSNTFTGATTVASGTLQLGSGMAGSIAGTSGVTINAGAILSFGRTDDYGDPFSVPVAGSGGITVLSGSVTTIASNSFAGPTVVGTGRLEVGVSGTAGSLDGTSSVALGPNAGGNGQLVLSSGSIRVSGTGGLLVGASGTGAVTITSGTMDVENGSSLIGSAAGGSGLATMNGGLWKTGGSMFVGRSGSGALTLSSGTILNGSATIGSLGGTGNAAVTGGIWQSSGSLDIGNSGTGAVAVSGSGFLQLVQSGTQTVSLASGSGSRGTLTVTSGTMNASGNVFVGREGIGILGISGGTSTVVGKLFIGQNLGGSGSATISGGSLTTGNGISVGDAAGSFGMVEVSGGLLTNQSQDLVVGNSGSGSLNVTSGTVALRTGAFAIGSTGTGNLLVTGGAITHSGGATAIGQFLSGSGAAMVRGGTWSTAGIDVGQSGRGLLTLADSGAIVLGSGTGVVTLARNAGAVGTFTFGTGTSVQVGTLSAAGIVGGSGTASVNFSHASPGYLLSVPLSGTLAVNQQAAGRTILSASNSYVGRTAVQVGTLQFANRAALYGGGTSSWTAANLTVSSTGTLAITLGGTAGNLFTATDIDVIKTVGTGSTGFLSGATLGLDTSSAPGGTFAYASPLVNPNGGSNALVVAKLGSGTLALSGTNSYTGGTLVRGGELRVTGGSIAHPLAGIGVGENPDEMASLVVAAGSVTGSNVRLATAARSSGTATVLGGTLTSNGTFTVGNSGTAALNLIGGTVSAGAGSGTVTLAAALGSQGTLNLGSGATAGTLNAAAVAGGLGSASVIFHHTSGSYAFAAALTGTMNVSQAGTGLTIATGANTFTGTTTIASGTLQVGNGGTTGSLGAAVSPVVNNSALVFARTDAYGGSPLANIISGSGSLTLRSGSLTLSGSNSYAGGTLVRGGTLSLGPTGAINHGLADVTLGSVSGDVATLSLSAGAITASNGILGSGSGAAGAATVSGGTWSSLGGLMVGQSGTGAMVLTGSGVVNVASGSGTITLAANPLSSGSLTVSSGLTSGTLQVGMITGGSGSALVAFQQSGTYTVQPVLSGSLAVTQSGSGATILTGANTYAGATTISSGVLQVGAGGTAGIIGSGSVVNNATLVFKRTDDYGGPTSANVTRSITGSGTVQLLAGSLALSGSSSYAGGTVIRGGTLSLTPTGLINHGVGNVLVGSGSGDVATLSLPAGVLTGSNGILGSGSAATGVASLSGSGIWTSNGGLTVGSLGTGTLSLADTALVRVGGTAGTGTLTLASGSGSRGTLNLGAGGISGTLQAGAVTGGVGTAAVVFNHTSGSYAFSPSLTGLMSLSHSGSGTTLLTGANTYTGTTTISAGTLQVGNSGTTGSLASGTSPIVNNAMLVFARTDAYGGGSIANAISGSGSILLASGSLTLSGSSSTYTGTTTIAGGTRLTINSDSAVGTGLVVVGGTTTLANASGAARSIPNSMWISGGDVTFSGTLPLSITGTTTLVGGARLVTVTSSTLTLGSIDADAAAWQLRFAGPGTLAISAAAQSGYQGGVEFGANGAGGTLLLGSGSALGTGALLLSATNTASVIRASADLTGSNAVANAVILQAPVVAFTGSNSITLAGAFTQALGSRQIISSLDVGRTLTLSGSLGLSESGTGRMLTVAGSGNTTLAGVIADGTGGGGSSGLSITNTATTTLAVDNTFSGTAVSSAGTLLLSNSLALQNATLAISGGTVAFSGTAGPRFVVGGLSGTGNVLLQSGTTAVVVQNGGNGVATTYSGTLSGIGGITKTGTSSLTLNAANVNTGTMTLTSGTLSLGNDAALGTGRLVIEGGVLDATATRSMAANNPQSWNGDFRFSGSSPLNMGVGSVTLSGGTRTVDVAAATLTVGGPIGDGGNALGMTKIGTGLLVLNGSNSYGGTTTLAGGTIQTGRTDSLGTTGSITFAGGVLRFTGSSASADWSSRIAGSSGAIALDLAGQSVTLASPLVDTNTGGLAVFGPGQLTLAGNSAYSGTTAIQSSGTLQIGGVSGTAGTLGVGPILDNGTLVFNRGDDYGGQVVNAISGSGKLVLSRGSLTLSASNSYAGGSTIRSGTLALSGGGVSHPSAAFVAGDVANDNGTLLLPSGAVTSGSGIVGNGAGAVGLATVSGGTWNATTTLVVGNSGTGTLNLTDGVVSIAGGTGTLTVASGSGSRGTLNIGTGTTAGVLSAAVVSAGSGVATVNFNHTSGSYGFSPRLSGLIAVSQLGSGQTTLTGSSNYAGGTLVRGGTLAVSSSASISHTGTSVIVASGSGDVASFVVSGLVQSGSGTIGSRSGAVGTATVDSGTWTNTGNLVVGQSGAGTLSITGMTARVSNVLANVGALLSSSGSVAMTGGTWANSGDLRLGDGGVGVLTLTSGSIGAVNTVLGSDTTGSGSAVISGGILASSGSIVLGNRGLGTLSLSSGLLSGASATFGSSAGNAVGMATVSGGTWSNAGGFTVGNLGSGTLSVTGGQVTIAGGTGTLTLASGTGSRGTLNIGTGTTPGVLAAAVVSTGSGTAAVNFNHTSGSYAFGPRLTGGLSLSQLGSGQTTLTGSSTHTGGTLVRGGTLAVSSTASISHTGTSVIVGNLGGDVATLVVQGVVQTGSSVIGAASGAVGSVFVSDSGTWSNTGNLIVGQSGSGDLYISGSGGRIINATAIVGGGAGSRGSVAMSGAGNTWVNSGDLRLGDSGTGTLSLTTGSISAANTVLGSGSMGTGFLHMTGGTFATSGSMVVGGGTLALGRMNLSGGLLSGSSVTVAGGSAATGVATVAGGTWSNAGSFTVAAGNSSVGTLNLTGGQVTIASGSGTLMLASGSFAAGTLNIGTGTMPGLLSAAVVSGGSAAGGLAAVNFNHTSGSYAFAPRLTGGLSLNQLGSGQTILTGSNTYSGGTLVSAGTLAVGASASINHTGTSVIVASGSGDVAAMVVSGSVGSGGSPSRVGDQAGASGSVLIQGGTWVNSGTIQLGVGGAGSLTLNGTSAALRTSALTIGAGPTGSGTATITAGSLAASGGLVVGDAGAGALNVSGTPAVVATPAHVIVGSSVTGSGAILVSAGTLAITQNLSVGNAGFGALAVSGGLVSATNSLLGIAAGATGTAAITGGIWNTGGNLVLGDFGTGWLTLAGGTVGSSYAILGTSNTGLGKATVTGGSWTTTGDLYVGAAGAGLVDLQGGSLTNYAATVGYLPDATGAATVSGGSWTTTAFTVGDSGTGSLSVTGGGIVNATSSLGYNLGGAGAATVTGGTWSSDSLTIGNLGVGTLAVGGGSVASKVAVVGNSAGSSGAATVSGGSLSSASQFIVGLSGTGSLTVSGSGIVAVGGGTGSLVLAQQPGSMGTLLMGDVGDAPGTLNLAAVASGSGTGQVVFGHASSDYVFDRPLVGGLAVRQAAGGTTSLTAANTYSGTTTISQGSLRIGNSGTAGTLGSGAVVNEAVLSFNRVDGYGGAYAGSISGGSGVMEVRSGMLTFAGRNTAGGGTIVRGGTLAIAAGGTIAHPAASMLVGAAAGEIGAFTMSGGSVATSSGTLGVAAGSSGFATVGGGIWSGSSFTIGSSGVGSLTLADSGVVRIGGGSGTLTIASSVGSVGTLTLAGVTPGTIYAGAVRGGSGTATVVLDHELTSYEFGPVLSGNLSLVQAGGTTTFRKSSPFSGLTDIQDGLIEVGTGGALGQGSGSLRVASVSGGRGGLAIGSSASFSSGVAVVGEALGAHGFVTISGGTLTTGSGLTIGGSGGGVISLASGAISVTGTSGILLARNTGATGLLAVGDGGTAPGSLAAAFVSGGSGSATLTLNHSAATFTFTPRLTGSMAFNVLGGGTTLMTGSNSQSGSTRITASTLQVGSGPSVSTLGQASVVNDGTLVFAAGGYGGPVANAISGTGGIVVRTGALTLAGQVSAAAGTVLRGGTVTVANGGSIIQPASTLVVGDVSGDRASLLVAGGSIAANSAVIGREAGTVGSVTMSGGSWTTPAGFLVGMSGSGSLGLSGSGTVTVGSGSGVLTLASGSTAVGRLLIGAGIDPGTLAAFAVTGGSGSATVVFNHNLPAYPFLPIMSGGLMVEQVGPGRTILAIEETYTGGTVIRGGTLAIAAGGVVRHDAASTVVAAAPGEVANLEILGGRLLNAQGIVAASGSSLGTVTIVGGTWSSDAGLVVGVSGTGVVSLSGRGVVTVGGGTGTLLLGQQPGSSGLLLLGSTGAIPGILSVGGVTSGSGAGIVEFSHTMPGYVFDRPLAGALAVRQTSSGTTVLTAANTYTGTTTVSHGTLQVGAGGEIGLLGSGPVINNATLAFNRADSYGGPLTNLITGTGTMVVQGGILSMAGGGVNRALGGTILRGGTLAILSGGTISSSSPTANLVVGSRGGDVASFAMSGGSVTNAVGVMGAAAGSSGNTTVTGGSWINLNGLIIGDSGTGQMTISGSGNVRLGFSGTGAVTIASGSGSVGRLIFGANVIPSPLSATAINGGLGQATVEFAQPGGFSMSANLGGTLAIDQSGSGRTILTGLNTFAGPITITSGTLQVGSSGTVGTLGSGSIVNNSVLAFARTDGYGGPLSRSIGGTGTVQLLSGSLGLTGSNSYAGGTLVTAGTLSLGGTGSIGHPTKDFLVGLASGTQGALSMVGGQLDAYVVSFGEAAGARGVGSVSGGVVSGNAVYVGASGSGTLNLSGGSITSGLAYIGSATGASGSVTLTGGTFGSRSMYVGYAATGNVQLSGGAIAVEEIAIGYGNSSAGLVTVTAGTLSVRNSASLGVDGGGTLNVSGSGVVSVGNGAGTLTLATGSASSGKLQIGDYAAPGTFSAGLVQAGSGSATVEFRHSSSAYTFATRLDGGLNLSFVMPATTILTANNSITGTTTVSSGTLRVGDGNQSGFLGSGSVVNNATLIFSRSDDYGSPLANSFTGSGTTTITGGTLTLVGNSSFAGVTRVSAGVLQIGNGGTIGRLGNGPIVNNSALIFNCSGTYGGPVGSAISGTGSVTLTTGALTLSGTSTYTGLTYVNGGRLVLDRAGIIGNSRSIAVNAGGVLDVSGTGVAGAFQVASGQTLGGSGAVAGSITVGAGATIAPGSSPGTLTVTENVGWAAGGNYNWQIADAVGVAGSLTGWDLLRVSGSLTITSGTANPFNINLWSLTGSAIDVSGSAANFNPLQGGSWTLASAAGGISGFATNKFTIRTTATNGTGGFANALAGGQFSIAQSGNDINLVFTPSSTITINVASGTQTQAQAGYPLLSGATPVVKTGAGTLVLDQANTLTGSTSVQAGMLRLATSTALASSPLAVVAGGTAQVAAAVRTTVAGLNLAGNGLLDVGSGLMTVTNGLSATDLVAEILEGRGNGSWNGTSGITSSTAAGDVALGLPRSVGWLDNGNSSVSFAFAAPGDTNLDWKIDVLDAANIIAGGRFNTAVPATWAQGDFNYDGIVNVLDAAGFLSTGLYNQGPYNPSPVALGVVAAVPEPAVVACGLFGLAGLLLRFRWRRRRRA